MTVNPPGAAEPPDLLTAHNASWLLRWARTQLSGSAPGPPLGPPPAGVRISQPATVVLTVFDDDASSAGCSGQGGGLLEALMSAVGGALLRSGTPGRLQLDIVVGDPTPIAQPQPDGALPDRASRQAWQRLTSFQDGLVVEHEGQAYWLVPNQLQLQGMARARRDVDAPRPADVLGAAMARLGLPADLWQRSPLGLWSYRTSSWIENAAHEQAIPLVQGSIPIERYDRARLLESAVAAGEYLLRVQRDDGSFIYTLDPWLSTRSRSAYNLVRHSGTAAALLELHVATADDRFLSAASRALAYQATWYRPGSASGMTYVLDKDGKGKLGALGLALVALTRKLAIAPDDAERDHALALARQIVAMQHPDGSFESYLQVKGNEPRGSVSLYYPGEAMLGLVRLARLGLDEGGFVAAAHRGADFLIESRRGKDRLPPDAWLLQALELLYADAPKPSYVEHAVAISRSMLSDQYDAKSSPAYAGGFGPEPIRSTRTTARIEGLVAAHRLAAVAGHDGAPGILAATMRTAPHLLPLQYGPDNSYFLARPEQADGGMRGGLDDAEIRIDYVQHHISAMLGLAGLLGS